ncbi:MAG: sulfite exporter TauE/SafE family protein [Sphingomonadaceae bacterium]|nr:sulfite exporter TauE/SafE family protein [Sphingomonadaceae bacterium]
MTATEILLALASGGLIGIVLGLVGGGGSILSVPLLVYVVGVGSAHAAIGTAAVAVTTNALASLVGHARAGMIKWPCAMVFAMAGVIGATAGAEIGKTVDGTSLLTLFGLLMISVGLSMLRKRQRKDDPAVRLSRGTAAALLPRLVPMGLGVGLAAGFFGIGGGFLIVPALMAATAMPFAYAVGTSLVVVTALGLTTAISYGLSGYVDWPLTILLVAGGTLGAGMGVWLGQWLASYKSLFERIFAVLVIAVGIHAAIGAA